MLRTLLAAFSLAVAAHAAGAAEALPTGAVVESLSARPAKVTLASANDYAQVVVLARLASGDTVDVTRIAERSAGASQVVSVSAAGQVRPLADGVGRVTFRVGGKSLDVPVTVTGAKATPAVSFVKDVQPALSKMGCNAGTCHGSAQGKNGFKLSLRGYDPVFDHRALTDDLEGRRYNRAAPARSLMLLKPSGGVPHTGGVTMTPGDPYYRVIEQWIASGLSLDLKAPRVTGVELFPNNLTVPLPGMRQQFAVVATYADGTTRDVSAEAFLESSNTEVATVDKAGVMTTVRRGEATILARYEGAYAASTAVVMGDRSGFAWKQLPVHNRIDELVDAKLKAVKITPGEVCDDATFLRRVHLDLTGLPPTAAAVRAFLGDTRPQRVKRDEVVDKLVGGEAFVEHWTNRWADLLQVNRKFLGDAGAAALRQWIKDAVQSNKPYDQFAYEVLTAAGSTLSNPPAAYFKTLRTPDAVMENTTQLFLAVRFNCNHCHDHPFEKWTQDQYFELSAFFAQVGRTEDPKYKGQKLGGNDVEKAKPLVEVVTDEAKGEFVHERTSLTAKPTFPFRHAGAVPADAPRRVRLAKWLTSADNPYFARSYANRVWSYLLGVGIIEPVDDIRAGNPPTNPALLDHLTTQFVASKFDTNALIKSICKSRTYQLAITTNEYNRDDDINYSHALPRRLPAEVLFDSIHRATGTPSRLPGLPAGARAAQLVDSNVDLPGGFLELFGKPVRESACECERSNTMMLGPVLAMVNGPIVADAVRDPAGRLAAFAAATPDDAKVVEEIYLSVLNRKPTAAEAAGGVKALHGAGTDHARLTADYAPKQAALAAYQATLPAKQAAWEASLLAQKPTAWTPLKVKSFVAKSGADHRTLADDSVIVSGKMADKDLYTVTAETDLRGITAVRLEAMTDPSLPAKGPGRAENGNFVLNEFTLTSRPLGQADAKPKPVKFATATASFAQEAFPVGNAIDGNPATGWAVAPQLGRTHTAVFPVAGPSADSAASLLTFTLDQRFGSGHTLGRYRLSATRDPNPKLGPPVAAELVKLLETPPAKRTPEQAADLAKRFAAQDAELVRLAAAVPPAPPRDPRVIGAQDLVWALMNSPAFLFNH